MEKNNARPIRWWPAKLILALAVAAYVALHFITLTSQQAFNLQVAKVIFGTGFLLLVWVMFFSRMRWRQRWLILLLTLATIALPALLFRIHGVNGNLIPILEPRWTQHNLIASEKLAAGTEIKAAPGAADFPQFLGPNRNAHLAGPKLATNWTTQPPVSLWRQDVGAGWSGFAVAGSIAITQEQRGEDECVNAYDLQTGKLLWSHADKQRYSNTLAGEGPRATPTIVADRVYTHGANSTLNCLTLTNGAVLWSKPDIGPVPVWGEATSPLVTNNLVIINSGGPADTALIAYHANNGSQAWSLPARDAGYSSPISATFAGTPQILIFAGSLIGADPATGAKLWEFPWPGNHPHVSTPVLAGGNDVIISSGYGTGSGRLSIMRDANGKWLAKQIWRTIRMKAKFTDLILYRDHIYGMDDGIMECIDAGTGALAWKDGRFGHGQILLVGDKLLMMAESGNVILVDPQPDRLRELTRFTALHEKTWNPPALAGEYLLVRNDKEAACFRLPVQN